MITNSPDHTIVIVGAGFSGCMTAVNLLRQKWSRPVRVILLEKNNRPALGVAYGTTHDWHYLNVNAGNMSALPDQPDDLTRYLRALEPTSSPSSQNPSSKSEPSETPQEADRRWRTFITRKQYGEYLQALLADAEKDAVSHNCHFELVHDEVLAIEPAKEVSAKSAKALRETTMRTAPHRYRCNLASGGSFEVDEVVLALGNAPPALPAVFASSVSADAGGSDYLMQHDPWARTSSKPIAPDDNVLFVGTGLTAVDKILELAEAGHRGKMVAISRHGFLPQQHNPDCLVKGGAPLPMPFTAKTAREALRWVREACKGREEWRPVVDSLRPICQQWWHELPQVEQKRFLRHLQAHWDVHRHRMAPQVGMRIHDLINKGQLEIRAGRVLSCRPDEQHLKVVVESREKQERNEFLVDAAINCTGPQTRLDKTPHPILAGLLTQGQITSNSLRAGLQVTDEFNIVAASGAVNQQVFALGPPLRGTFFETVAVPELRKQAHTVAQIIFRRLQNSENQ